MRPSRPDPRRRRVIADGSWSHRVGGGLVARLVGRLSQRWVSTASGSTSIAIGGIAFVVQSSQPVSNDDYYDESTIDAFDAITDHVG